MDPSFSEKSLGFKPFSDFLGSRSDLVDLDESSTTRMVRLHSDTRLVVLERLARQAAAQHGSPRP
jgi:hypothetical protein